MLREGLCLSTNRFPNYSKEHLVGISANQVTKEGIGEQLKENKMNWRLKRQKVKGKDCKR